MKLAVLFLFIILGICFKFMLTVKFIMTTHWMPIEKQDVVHTYSRQPAARWPLPTLMI